MVPAKIGERAFGVQVGLLSLEILPYETAVITPYPNQCVDTKTKIRLKL